MTYQQIEETISVTEEDRGMDSLSVTVEGEITVHTNDIAQGTDTARNEVVDVASDLREVIDDVLADHYDYPEVPA
jgi:hypothetical protein